LAAILLSLKSPSHQHSEKSKRVLVARSAASWVVIGPTNSANQASEWARVLRSEKGAGVIGAKSLRISIDPGLEWFTTDLEVRHEDRIDETFRIKLAERELVPARALLLESLRPIFGFRKRKGFTQRDAVDDLLLARRMGKKVGAVFHGSDIRDVDAHAARNPHSPFHQNRPEVEELRKRGATNREYVKLLQELEIPIFVTTVDLFHEIPSATWLPPVIDIDKFAAVANRPMYTSKRLRVLYLPSKSWLKSSDEILPILAKLQGEEIIEFVNYVEHGPVKHEQVPELIADCDLVIDQFLGVVGVFPLEVLAANRILLTYIPPEQSGEFTPPHIQITPETLESVLRELAVTRPVPAPGLEYVRRWHDGNYSREVLIRTLGLAE
jgi:hypothetical protein